MRAAQKDNDRVDQSDLKTRLLDILSSNFNTRNNEYTDKELDLEIYSQYELDISLFDTPFCIYNYLLPILILRSLYL